MALSPTYVAVVPPCLYRIPKNAFCYSPARRPTLSPLSHTAKARSAAFVTRFKLVLGKGRWMRGFLFSEWNTSQWVGWQPHCGGRLFTHLATCSSQPSPASSGRPGSGGWAGESRSHGRVPRSHGRAVHSFSEHWYSVEPQYQVHKTAAPLSARPSACV